jgi:CRP/FNR family transcriptional regulator, cyclic AMP receptor protein
LATIQDIGNTVREGRDVWTGRDPAPVVSPEIYPQPLRSLAPRETAVHGGLFASTIRKTTLHLSRGTTVYWHGDRADTVCFNLRGTVLLKVVSPSGREGVVDIVTQGGIFGETCVFDDPYRTSSAVTVEPTMIVTFDKRDVRTILRNSPVHSEEFMRHLILRNNRIQDQLQDQLFSSSERRLARILRLLASGRERAGEKTLLPRISQSVLASIVGTTRSRICYFLIEFRKTGMVENLNGLRVDTEMIDAMLGK